MLVKTELLLIEKNYNSRKYVQEQSYDHASSYLANDVQDMPGNAIVPIIP